MFKLSIDICDPILENLLFWHISQFSVYSLNELLGAHLSCVIGQFSSQWPIFYLSISTFLPTYLSTYLVSSILGHY